MRVLITLMFIFNFALAKDSTYAVSQYLYALKNKDSSNYKNFMSDNFIKQLGGNDKIIDLFKQNELFVPVNYDLSFKSSHRKDVFFVNLRYLEKKKKHSSWFKVIKVEEKFFIDGIVQDME